MLQDCPEGEKCTAYVTEEGYCCVDANRCAPIIGDLGFGEFCTRGKMNDDCDKGLFCMTETSGSTGDGVCLAFCTGGYGPCDVGGECRPQADGVLPLCEDECDPLAPDCSPGEACYSFVALQFFFHCARTDHLPGEGGDGDPCAAIQACEAGFVCVDGTQQSGCTADHCCTPVCEVGNDGPCIDPDESCVPVYEPGYAPPGLEDVGYCGLG
jgi:hypothetical protein